MEERYTISEAAKALGVTPETLKNWEKRGKTPPARRDFNDFRYYSSGDLANIRKLRDGSQQ